MNISRRWVLSAAVALAATAGASIGSAAAAGASGADRTPGAIVRTDSGPVRGTVFEGYRQFLGVPFAAPPVGALRWRPPRRPAPWTTPRDATKPGNRCAQGGTAGTPSTEEDCLYLNVTTPDSARPARLRPVMVWLHGGGLAFGDANEIDPHRMAVTGDVVVVSVNFRLGLLAYFGHPSLADSGGFGLEDQQAALRWVRRNAAAFGGDRRSVTLFGQSGGAYGVCAQLTSPGSRGLFHRAIMQTGTCTAGWPRHGVFFGIPAGTPWIPLSRAHANGVALANELGCTDPATAVDCLRRVPVADLLAGGRGDRLAEVAFGNGVLPLRPQRALATGRFHRVPVISGNTRDEVRLSIPSFPQPFTEEQYQRLLVEAFGEHAPRVAAQYPSSAQGSPALAWAAVATDRVWVCSQLRDERRLTRWTPTFGYEFADRQAPPVFPFPFPPDAPPGASHASELAYLFDLVGPPPAQLTPAQRELATQMIGYWTRFAATGDPNGPDLPRWSRFRRSAVQALAPGAIHPVNLDGEHHCGFWATVA
jgi:para-nitrobenzyl esterase